jgi:hypothetical protein
MVCFVRVDCHPGGVIVWLLSPSGVVMVFDVLAGVGVGTGSANGGMSFGGTGVVVVRTVGCRRVKLHTTCHLASSEEFLSFVVSNMGSNLTWN